jgi:hypothetical protein
MTEEQKHVVIIDSIGRTIIGKKVSEDTTTLTLNNPIIVHCQIEQNGQIQVNNFPIFFFEFCKEGTRDKNDWTFNKASIVQSNVTLADKVLEQYSKVNQPAAPAVSNPKIIEITDL